MLLYQITITFEMILCERLECIYQDRDVADTISATLVYCFDNTSSSCNTYWVYT